MSEPADFARLPRPAAVCFDAFNTLVTLGDPAGRLVENLGLAGLAVSRAVAEEAWRAEMAVYRELAHTACDEASLEELRFAAAEALFDSLRRHHACDLPLLRCREILLASLDFQILPGALDCLQTLADSGVRLAVVSNWDCGLEQVLRDLDLRRWFEVVVISAVEGVEKPDPRIWEPALAALGVARHEVWHVGDDLEADVGGALAAGLTPVWVRPPASLGALPQDSAPPDGVAHIASLAQLPALLPG